MDPKFVELDEAIEIVQHEIDELMLLDDSHDKDYILASLTSIIRKFEDIAECFED